MKHIVPQLSWSICASFSKNNVCKKLSFPLETFCSTRNKRNLFVSLVTAASLAQAIKVRNGAGLDLFCRDTGSIQRPSLLFFFFSSLISLLRGLGEFLKVMQALDYVSGLLNCLKFS